MAGADEPTEYLEAHVAELLSHDPRVSELGLQVRVHGRRLVVTGAVSTEPRRAAVPEVVAALAPDYDICNDTTVAGAGEPAADEVVP